MRTELVTLDGRSDTAKIAHAAQILRGGGLVAFPTETVYGIAADARNPEALAQLARVKGKLDNKNYSLLVGSVRQAESVSGGLPRAARKLARLYWPGALTIVVHRASGGKAGLRLSEHPVARSLLNECGFPLAVPSAAIPKKLNALSAAEVRAAYDGQIALVLEGNPRPKGQPSTVVEVNDHVVSVMREGSIPEFDVLHAASPTVLFACTGNTCRSPMAAALCHAALSRTYRLDALPAYVISAGTNAMPGAPAHPLAITAMREAGLDISSHRATLLTPDLIDSADWVYTMTRAHRDSILEFMPAAAERVRQIAPSGEDISDPGGSLLARYRRARDKIAGLMPAIVEMVTAES